MPKIRRRAFRPDQAVQVRCPTAKGLLEGEGLVIRLIDHQPCGASGFQQPIYLVAMGERLKAIPHEFLTLRESFSEAISQVAVEPRPMRA